MKTKSAAYTIVQSSLWNTSFRVLLCRLVGAQHTASLRVAGSMGRLPTDVLSCAVPSTTRWSLTLRLPRVCGMTVPVSPGSLYAVSDTRR